ncbi:hypothetical protein Barb4_02983 [Bacteroidales bacterium Barb4]|nr:hypothetical protein Barb4_02983 [Bacteroidales bacterium Barb4]
MPVLAFLYNCGSGGDVVKRPLLFLQECLIKDNPIRGILKGYRISAPHAAQRNVGLHKKRHHQVSSERTMQNATYNMLSFFQNSLMVSSL